MSNVCRVGDEGQRYEVRATNNEGEEITIGWTPDKDGQPFIRMVSRWPGYNNPRVIDREADE